MTKRVLTGNVPMGANAPVSIQSMTNTDTRDSAATVEQILRLEAAGCEIVRSSVYDEACARAIPKIKEQIHIPLVADVHFDYRLAVLAMEQGVDKVRFNPGNIGGEDKVKRLVDCAKAHHVPIRVGVNGGSLERELLDQYGGPTPQALAESALRHVAILEREGFSQIVVSAKASNVPDTIAVYRLLHQKLDYPLHLGVTEAGYQLAGVIKSAMGIGCLLLEGIGDTIRVSLTGDPVQEVLAAQEILRAAGLRREGLEVVSCPTCGRCGVNLEKVVERVKQELPACSHPVKLAVMGCAVNGPGEAREADMGIAFGHDNAVVFRHGQQCYSGPLPEVIDRFLFDAKQLIQEGVIRES